MYNTYITSQRFNMSLFQKKNDIGTILTDSYGRRQTFSGENSPTEPCMLKRTNVSTRYRVAIINHINTWFKAYCCYYSWHCCTNTNGDQQIRTMWNHVYIPQTSATKTNSKPFLSHIWMESRSNFLILKTHPPQKRVKSGTIPGS
jgi:hypothetical protein